MKPRVGDSIGSADIHTGKAEGARTYRPRRGLTPGYRGFPPDSPWARFFRSLARAEQVKEH